MAENIIETRIRLRYDTYDNWMESSVILKAGEVAIASFDNSSSINPSISQYTSTSAIGMTVGNGVSYFYQLPWIQAIAADVYNWAKSSIKPTYTAQEIQGLQSFIEQYVNGGGDVTITPRIYQIVRGTGENINRYYLQYRENIEGSQWILDTSHYIDLEDLATIKTWLSGATDNLNEYFDLNTKISEQVLIILNLLNYADQAVNNQFVTSVTQTQGQIEVFRAQPTFDNISGILDVSKGGIGRNTVPSGHVLVGAEDNIITTVPIANEITNNNALVPNYLIKQYVDNATRGISGAMHFIGEATVVIRNNSNVNPNIIGYNFTRAQPGDVILYEEKEFVWNGSTWQLLGDETSYAIKGSITDSDIAEDAEISQSKIANLNIDLNLKVDKIEGKGLSTQDYTTEEKDKLETIEEGAQRNLIEHIFVNEREQNPTTIQNLPNSVALSIDVFDKEHADKLDGIEEGAQRNVIEHILLNGTLIQPVKIQNMENAVDLILDFEEGAQVNKVESININGTSFTPNNQSKSIDITLDPSILKFNIIEGAKYPINSNEYASINIDEKKIVLNKIAATGNIDDLIQTPNTYVILNCGSSENVI